MAMQTSIDKFVSSFTKARERNEEFFGEEPIPRYSEYYVMTVRHARELSVHADGLFPFKLLRSRAPNEQPDEFEYRRLNYQPVTQPAWEKAEKTVNRIWNRNNFKVTWHDQDSTPDDEKAQTYFEEDYPEYKSIYSYFENVVTSFTFKDPNAVVVIKPRDIPTKLDIDGDLKADQTELLEPIAQLYESKQVVSYVQGVHVMVLTNERVRLEGDGKGEATGKVYEFYDDQIIYRLVEFGKKTSVQIRIDIYYEHELGYLPAWRLAGKPQQMGEKTINQSYFDAAIPKLNIAVTNSSTLFMSIYAHAFPQRWEYVDPCKSEGCEQGYIWDHDRSHRTVCDNCNGRGVVTTQSPLGTKEIRTPDQLDNADVFSSISIPPMGYVSPSDVILKFLQDLIKESIAEAFMFINIDISNSKIQGGETATKIIIDREEMFAFLLKLTNVEYDLLGNVIDTAGAMRYDPSNIEFEDPDITKPTEFRIRNQEEVTEEIGRAVENHAPDTIIKDLLKELYEIRFNLIDNRDATIRLIFFSDRALTKTELDINAGISIGTFAKWEKVLHDSIEIFIKDAQIADEKFFEKTLEEQRTDIQERAKLVAVAIAPPATGTTESIIAEANAEPTGANQ